MKLALKTNQTDRVMIQVITLSVIRIFTETREPDSGLDLVERLMEHPT